MTANSPLQRIGQEKGIAMGSQELQRKLGFWAVLAIAVGTTVGSGIFVSVGEGFKAQEKSTISTDRARVTLRVSR